MRKESRSFERGWIPEAGCLLARIFGTLPSRMVNQCLILCDACSGHFMWPMGGTG